MTIGSHRIGRPPSQGKDGRVHDRVRDLETRPEKWLNDTGWTSPTLNGPYTVNTTVRYKRDANGVVWIQGYVNTNGAASGSTMFTLPAGFRPTANRRWATGGTIGGLASDVDVQADGQVKLYFPAGGAIGIDGCFPAEQ